MTPQDTFPEKSRKLAIAGTASDVCGSIRACDAKKTGCDLCKLDAIK